MESAIFGLVGVILGLSATAIWNLIERKERFKVLTFEKRLEAHQKAFYWNQEIYDKLSTTNDKKAENLKVKIDEVKEWWNTNCLLLDKKSQKSFIALINSGYRYVRNINNSGTDLGAEAIWHTLDKNLSDITSGIGTKHLDRTKYEKIPTEIKVEKPSTTPHDGIHKEYLLALAPAFLIGSYIFLKSTINSTPTVHFLFFSYTLPEEMKYLNIGISIFLLAFALFLCYLVIGRIPKSKKDEIYRWVAGFGGLTVIFYMYDWIKNLADIITSDIWHWYFYLFYGCGLLVLAVLIIYPYATLVIWFRKKRSLGKEIKGES